MDKNQSPAAGGFYSAEDLRTLRECLAILRECLPVTQALVETGQETQKAFPAPAPAA